jgi:hypothetical protein
MTRKSRSELADVLVQIGWAVLAALGAAVSIIASTKLPKQLQGGQTKKRE